MRVDSAGVQKLPVHMEWRADSTVTPQHCPGF